MGNLDSPWHSRYIKGANLATSLDFRKYALLSFSHSFCSVSIPFVHTHSFSAEHWCSYIHFQEISKSVPSSYEMKLSLSLLLATSIATLTNAHGYFVSPKARLPGPAFQAACGQQAYYNMVGDINGNIQGLQSITANQPDYNPNTCHLWKCKGMKYADNKANVHRYSPGQVIPMDFEIRAPHDGYANVSIVRTVDNRVIYPNLKKWSQYALTSIPMKESWEKFSVKMPTTLGSQCARPGHCVIQMYWNAPSIDQTYESCIDFTMSGGSAKRGIEGLEMEERAHPRDFNQV